MLLVSYKFAAFFAGLAVVYYSIPRRYQWVLLLAASYLFYAGGGPVYLLYPMATTLSVWLIARRLSAMERPSKRLLLLGLLLNFGILAVLKYTNFALGNLNRLAGTDYSVSWVLPLGISYYTFQSMGYLIDVYHGKYKAEPNLARFALFVSFFPQMTAGPINRFDAMKQELFAEHRPDSVRIWTGAQRMLTGYFKKLVIADRIGPAVSAIIASPEVFDGPYVLLGMLGYTVWMYADFAGGIDIVIGAAQILGIRMTENFDRPFASRSLAEFWRRWHMSLMQWLREYIFFPAASSRFSQKTAALFQKWFGKKCGRKAPVYIANLTVWLIAGIWHGASWNFVVWGLANCVVMLISAELTGVYRKFRKRFAFTGRKWYRCFEVVRTFLLFCWLEMFEYYPFMTVFAMTANLAASLASGSLADGRLQLLGLERADWLALLISVLLLVLSGILTGEKRISARIRRSPAWMQYAAVFGLFLAVLITGVYGRGYEASQFIYNQF